MASVTALVVVASTGCASSAAGTPTIAPSSSPTVVQVLDDYELYTHCGIREAKVGRDFYLADPEQGDGGNPPQGWGNPSQRGTMTVRSDGTARFSAPGGLSADFRVRPGATDWILICS
ncbi:MAG: hypothetical protein U0S36_02225 [Candidatus Nanopelagicales bacterium]